MERAFSDVADRDLGGATLVSFVGAETEYLWSVL